MDRRRVRLRELPIISIILVSINVIVFIICQFTDKLYILGRVNVSDVLGRGEYGRIVWSLFLHADQNHLFNNMLILFFLGAMIEREVGHIRYALYFFVSGIGGNLFSLFVKYLNNDISSSIGASGAVFGLDGVLLALMLFSGRKMSTVTPVRVALMILLSLYSGFTGGNIDNAAHVGGLLIGFIAASLVCVVQRRKDGRKL